MSQWWNEYVAKDVDLNMNRDISTLVTAAVTNGEGELSSQGALVVKTGKFTGRATEDKYVVKDNYSTEKIDWENGVNVLSPEQFNKLKSEFTKKIKDLKRVYIMERSVGADPKFSLGVRVITSRASHALFSRHMFREPLKNPSLGHFTIFHCPELELEPKAFGLKNPTIIAINFTSMEILIAGTAYAGEMKKAIFSVMNTLLPDQQVLPMHAGANVDEAGKVSVFFGLSGTGKTTLSTDVGKILIGDDEHGISPQGIFNLEGGCYAKTYKLTEAGEPQVFHAVNRFGAILENVVLNENHDPLFDDKSITENGRGSYPLTFISDASESGAAAFPSNIFFLSADAMGVLPAVAKLDPEQAMYYFLSGYTAKLAGTEVGLAGIKTAFSHCFGAPFMMRHPKTYAELLKDYIKGKSVNVWLINTGWYGGAYGVGKRYDLSTTRGIIRAIQKGLNQGVSYEKEPCFGLNIPTALPGVEAKYLNARSLWKDSQEYDNVASRLRFLFDENFQKFS